MAAVFFASKHADEPLPAYIERVLGSTEYDLLTTLDELVSSRMMSDDDLKLHTTTNLLRLSEHNNSPPEVLLSHAHDMAHAHESLQQADVAISLYEKVLQARERLRGDKESDTITTVHSLAGVYSSKGDLTTALGLYQEAIPKLQCAMEEERVEHRSTLEALKLKHATLLDAQV
ncbi:hypothetical protein TeGR_g13775, partial [Tetraparma gracilis]